MGPRKPPKHDVEAIGKRAYSYAYRLCRNREKAEDAAQSVVLIVLENPEWHHNVRYRICDVIRGILGRKGARFNDCRRSIHNALRLNPFDDDAGGEIFGPQVSGLECVDAALDLRKRLAGAAPRRRRILELLLEGYTLDELGKANGLNETRMCQIKRDALLEVNGQQFRKDWRPLRKGKAMSEGIESRKVVDDPFYMPVSGVTEKSRRQYKKSREVQKCVWEKPFQTLMQELEIELVKKAIIEAKGVINRAAVRCGLNRTTLVEKMKKLGLKSQDILAEHASEEAKAA